MNERQEPAPLDRAAEALRRLRQAQRGVNGARYTTLPGGPAEDALDQLHQALAEARVREEALRQEVEGLELRLQAAHAGGARYRELFEFVPDAYLLTDLTGNILEANQAATTLFGRVRQFLIGSPLPFFTVAEDRRRFYTRLAELARGLGGERAWEGRLLRGGGVPWDAEASAAPVPDGSGRAAGLRWLFRDVTAQKQAAEELRAAKEFTEGLLAAAEAAVLVAGPGGEVLFANAYLQALSGYGLDEMLGRDWCELLLPRSEWQAAREEFGKVPTGGELSRGVHPIRARDGRLRVMAWSARRLAKVRRADSAVLLVGHDVTELQRAQQQALQLERLAAIGQMSAGLAHESRNALQRVQACLSRLAWRCHDDPDSLDLVGRAQRAQEDLVRLYEDVCAYAAPIRVEPRPCELAGVWREAWAQAVAVCPGRDARLEEDAGQGPFGCLADAFRLTQVFRNLFDNSLAAASGPCRVTVACREDPLDGRPALRVAVRDNGPGLDAEQRSRLFEPFFTTKTKGTGLGMPIAKRIVEAHGGRIEVGEPGPPGTEIVITLPRGGP